MTRRLVLASASPRRRELLAGLGIEFDVEPADIDESNPPAMWIEGIPRQLAALKARTVAARHPDAVVLAADTIVVKEGRVLGKPRTASDARRMLRSLRSRWHVVITGVALVHDGHSQAAHVVTRVKLRLITGPDMVASIARGDPFDKAGGYAIQDTNLNPVEQYDGCYCNVVGLPLGVTLPLLRDAGINVTQDTAAKLLPQCASCLLFKPPASNP